MVKGTKINRNKETKGSLKEKKKIPKWSKITIKTQTITTLKVKGRKAIKNHSKNERKIIN